MDKFEWILALAALALILLGLSYRALPPRRKPLRPLPGEWALSPRPVFNTNERRAYRMLREALPQHIVLSKLPLVRFCQPVDATQTRYWYELLGTIHVGFAICSANGRVLAAIDLELDRGVSTRILKIKQSVLESCRVRYLRCPPDQLPSLDELHALLPNSGTAPLSTPSPAAIPPDLTQARESLVTAVASRRAQRTNLWHDNSAFQDSFFAPDSRFDSLSGLDFPPAPPRDSSLSDHAARRVLDDDVGGIVVDRPTPPPRLRGA